LRIHAGNHLSFSLSLSLSRQTDVIDAPSTGSGRGGKRLARVSIGKPKQSHAREDDAERESEDRFPSVVDVVLMLLIASSATRNDSFRRETPDDLRREQEDASRFQR